MKKQEQWMILRTKKLGLLLLDARQSAGRSPEDCARAAGISLEEYLEFEDGQDAPSLPTLEALAFFLHAPMDHFWESQTMPDDASILGEKQLKKRRKLRNRILGTRLQAARTQALLSPGELAEMTCVPEERILQCEEGEISLSLPELELMAVALNLPVEAFWDQNGRIGEWIVSQKAAQQFQALPRELRQFVAKPVNRPFLESAIHLSQLPADKLRALAEGLLEITY